jgi:hypothetical protein
LRRVDAAQDGLIKDLEAMHDPTRATPLSPAGKDAMRDRIQHRFSELQTERETIQKDLATLVRHPARDNDPALIDTLPQLAVSLPDLPARLQQQLYHACDLEMIYRQHLNQVTINVTITSTTADDVTALLGEITGETPENSAPRWGLITAPSAALKLRDHGWPQRPPTGAFRRGVRTART